MKKIQPLLQNYFSIKKLLDLLKNNGYAGLYKLKQTDLVTTKDKEYINTALNNDKLLTNAVSNYTKVLTDKLHTASVSIGKVIEVNKDVSSLDNKLQTLVNNKITLPADITNDSVSELIVNEIKEKELGLTKSELINNHTNKLIDCRTLIERTMFIITKNIKIYKDYLNIIEKSDLKEKELLVNSIRDIYINELDNPNVFIKSSNKHSIETMLKTIKSIKCDNGIIDSVNMFNELSIGDNDFEIHALILCSINSSLIILSDNIDNYIENNTTLNNLFT